MSQNMLLRCCIRLATGLLAIGLMVGYGLSASLAQARDVTIGAIEILTGPNAAYGTAIRDGLLLARDEINAAGGLLGGKLTLVVEDSAGTKEGAVNAVRKLIGQDKASLLIGPTLSTEMFAAGPVANERKIPIIGTSTTAAGITDLGEYVFRTATQEADQVMATFKAAKNRLGVKRVAILYANDDTFSKSGFDAMKAAAEKLGMETVAIESFASKDRDFSAQLTKIKALNPDAVAISSLVEPMAGILLQIRQLGFPATVRILGGNGASSPKLAELAGAAANGMTVSSPWFIDKPDTVNRNFVANFEKTYQYKPDMFAAQAYDTLHIVAEAILRAGSVDTAKLAPALLQTDHNGIMGPFRFTKNREPALIDGIVVLQITDGDFRLLP